MIAAMMVAVVSANAQEAGQMFIKPMVGATMAKLTKVDDSKMKFGLVGGGEFGYCFSNRFAATGGLLVAMQGTKVKDTEYYKDASTSLTYLNVPLLANFYVIPGLALKAGFQPGFLLSAKMKGKENVGGSWIEYENTGTDGMKKLDLSIPLGISYEIADFVIDARYNLGLTKVQDDVDCKNSVFMLTIGYKIPLNY